MNLINFIPSPILHNKSPYKLLTGKLPNYSHLRIFGCLCFPLLKPYNTHKLEPKSQSWTSKLDNVLKILDFTPSKADTSLYIKHCSSYAVLLLAYVDNIIITGSHTLQVSTVIQDLHKFFSLKDLGELDFFLGVEIKRS